MRGIGNLCNSNHCTFLTGHIHQNLFIIGMLGKLNFLYSGLCVVIVNFGFTKEFNKLTSTPSLKLTCADDDQRSLGWVHDPNPKPDAGVKVCWRASGLE